MGLGMMAYNSFLGNGIAKNEYKLEPGIRSLFVGVVWYPKIFMVAKVRNRK